jgi:hypothetical protein
MDLIDEAADYGRVWTSAKRNEIRNGGQIRRKQGQPETYESWN